MQRKSMEEQSHLRRDEEYLIGGDVNEEEEETVSVSPKRFWIIIVVAFILLISIGAPVCICIAKSSSSSSSSSVLHNHHRHHHNSKNANVAITNSELSATGKEFFCTMEAEWKMMQWYWRLSLSSKQKGNKVEPLTVKEFYEITSKDDANEFSPDNNNMHEIHSDASALRACIYNGLREVHGFSFGFRMFIDTTFSDAAAHFVLEGRSDSKQDELRLIADLNDGVIHMGTIYEHTKHSDSYFRPYLDAAPNNWTIRMKSERFGGRGMMISPARKCIDTTVPERKETVARTPGHFVAFGSEVCKQKVFQSLGMEIKNIFETGKSENLLTTIRDDFIDKVVDNASSSFPRDNHGKHKVRLVADWEHSVGQYSYFNIGLYPKSEPQSKPQPEPQSELQPELQPVPQPPLQIQPQPQAEPQAQPKPQPQSLNVSEKKGGVDADMAGVGTDILQDKNAKVGDGNTLTAKIKPAFIDKDGNKEERIVIEVSYVVPELVIELPGVDNVGASDTVYDVKKKIAEENSRDRAMGRIFSADDFYLSFADKVRLNDDALFSSYTNNAPSFDLSRFDLGLEINCHFTNTNGYLGLEAKKEQEEFADLLRLFK